MIRELFAASQSLQVLKPFSLQAQHDYLTGAYPVVRDDAAQMCALQMQAECGPNLSTSTEALDAAIEKFVVKQVTPSSPLYLLASTFTAGPIVGH